MEESKTETGNNGEYLELKQHFEITVLCGGGCGIFLLEKLVLEQLGNVGSLVFVVLKASANETLKFGEN